MNPEEDAHGQKISDRAVINGIKIEFDRTLPFWRCFTDLESRFGHRPVVIERETTLTCRLPCTVFKGVDVVWAVTTVTMNVQTGAARPVLSNTTASAGGSSGSSGGASTTAAGHKRRAEAVADSGGADAARLSSLHSRREAKKRSRYWRNVPHETYTYRVGTMHFVHDDAHMRGSLGAARSFHVQSVVLYETPALLQCVAGTMVVFAFLVYAANTLLHAGQRQSRAQEPPQTAADTSDGQDKTTKDVPAPSARMERALAQAGLAHLGIAATWDRAEEQEIDADGILHYRLHRPPTDASLAHPEEALFPRAASRVLVLGMGGNSMALALRELLGPEAELCVVEVEPAVVQACQAAGTVRLDDPHLTVHTRSAQDVLPELAPASFDMTFMDLFEPLKGSMENEASLMSQVVAKLTVGGLLVVNDHQLPTAKGLAPLVARFGNGNVQAVNLHGWKESVIVCVQPGHPENDSLGTLTSRCTMNTVFMAYERLVPGWLPPPSWLQKSISVGAVNARARVWTS